MTDSNHLKIIVINSLVASEGAGEAVQQQAERARALRIGLLEAGCNIVAALPPDADLQQQIAQLKPDLIIVDAQSDAALKKVVSATAGAPRPIVCFTEDGDKQKMYAAIAAGVSAYVVAGLSADRVKAVLDAAMARFTVDRKLRDELCVGVAFCHVRPIAPVKCMGAECKLLFNFLAYDLFCHIQHL
jgi:response regulator NasT